MIPREHRAYDALAAVVARLPREHRAYDAIVWPFVSAVFLIGRIVDPIVCWWANRSHLPIEGEQ